MKAGIYIRVSSAEQAEEGYSVGSQTDKLKAYCKAMDYDIYDIYTDPGFTGANINRPAMQKLIADVISRKIDIILVMKLDRLSRSQKDTLYLIEDVFLKNGCEFVSVTESFDTSTPMGRAFIGILAVFAQFERERISERTMDGKIERAKTGKPMGWMNVPIGYDYVNELYVINEYESSMVKRIFNLAEEGCSMNEIKRVIDKEYPLGTKYETIDNTIHINTIKRILKNNVYTGIVKFRNEEYEGIHEAIITQEQFDKVQKIREIMNKNAVGSRKNPFRSTHLLTGFIYCGICGARLHSQTRLRMNNSQPYYICYSVSKSAPKYAIDPNCNLGFIDGKTLDDYVINEIKKMKEDRTYFNKLIEEVKHIQDIEKVYKSKIKSVDNKLKKLMDLYLSDIYSKDELEKKNIQLVEEKKQIEEELEKVKKSNKQLSSKEARKHLRNVDKIFESGTLEEKKSLISTLIDRIIITNEAIEIKLTFS